MGMYTSFYKKVPCRRCRQKSDTDFQVKFGDDLLEIFRHGDKVPRDFQWAKGDYAACYGVLCEYCSSFTKSAAGWLRDETLYKIQQLHTVELDGGHGRTIRSGPKKIAEISTFGDVIAICSSKDTWEYKNLCAHVRDFWKAHLRAMGNAFAVKVTQESSRKLVFPGDNSRFILRLSNVSEYGECVVRVGKIFQVLENRKMPMDEEHFGTRGGKKVYLRRKNFVGSK